MTDEELLRAFEDRSLPFDQWTHRAHLKIAYLYVSRYPFEEALGRVARNIKAYNAANSRPDGPATGYNQTTTHALLHLVAAVNEAYAEAFPAKTADEFCDLHPELMSKHVLRFFYSPGRRMHPLTKLKFIEPDLAPLPKIGSAPMARDWLAVRPATAGDLPELGRVKVESWRTTYDGIVAAEILQALDVAQTARRMAEYFDAAGKVSFMAEYQKAGIAGYINGGPSGSKELPFDSEIYAIYLLKEHRRKGIGKALVAALAGWLRGRGHRSMCVWVLEENPARGFYESLGGRRVGRKEITLGGASHSAAYWEIAYGWDDIDRLADLLP
jgi:GNAT superfamily N-acetyltransferase